MSRRLEIFSDGACSGNPGLAAIGVVIQENGATIKELSAVIGIATNNIAEYTALIYALQEALILRADDVKVFTDSQLMYEQLRGQYKVKHENIKPLFEQVQRLRAGFKKLEIQYVPREQNSLADNLAKQAIKKEQTKVVASPHAGGEESPSSTG